MQVSIKEKCILARYESNTHSNLCDQSRLVNRLVVLAFDKEKKQESSNHGFHWMAIECLQLASVCCFIGEPARDLIYRNGPYDCALNWQSNAVNFQWQAQSTHKTNVNIACFQKLVRSFIHLACNLETNEGYGLDYLLTISENCSCTYTKFIDRFQWQFSATL